MSDTHEWVGAWWLGFIVLAAFVLATAAPLFAFPRQLRAPEAAPTANAASVSQGRTETLLQLPEVGSERATECSLSVTTDGTSSLCTTDSSIGSERKEKDEEEEEEGLIDDSASLVDGRKMTSGTTAAALLFFLDLR